MNILMISIIEKQTYNPLEIVCIPKSIGKIPIYQEANL